MGDGKLSLHYQANISLRDVARLSLPALDEPVRDATLRVGILREAGGVLGAFERCVSDEVACGSVRRLSGGPTWQMAPGTIYMGLSLEHLSVLEPCDTTRIINRYVRPLLRGLTLTAGPAHYFGRDFVSVRHRPVGWVGFAHDASSGRCLVEAFLGVHEPIGTEARVSWLGKCPVSLEVAAGMPLESERIAEAIAASYGRTFGTKASEAGPEQVLVPGTFEQGPDAVTVEPPWEVVASEAIGLIGGGPDGTGRWRLGGEFLASRDAVRRLEEGVQGLPPQASKESVEALVDQIFGDDRVALEGVRSLATFRDLILRGLSRERTLGPVLPG